MTQHLDDSVTLHVTSGSTEEQTIERALAEKANGDLLPLATRRRRKLERSGMKAFVGRCSGAAVGKLPAVTAMVASYGDTPLAQGTVEGVLKPHGLVHFEGHMGLLLETAISPERTTPRESRHASLGKQEAWRLHLAVVADRRAQRQIAARGHCTLTVWTTCSEPVG